MILLSMKAQKELEKYPNEKVDYAKNIVRKQALELANKDDSLSEKVLRNYDIVYLPITSDILKGGMSDSNAKVYADTKLKEYMKDLP